MRFILYRDIHTYDKNWFFDFRIYIKKNSYIWDSKAFFAIGEKQKIKKLSNFYMHAYDQIDIWVNKSNCHTIFTNRNILHLFKNVKHIQKRIIAWKVFPCATTVFVKSENICIEHALFYTIKVKMLMQDIKIKYHLHYKTKPNLHQQIFIHFI